jgi:recombination protein RecR
MELYSGYINKLIEQFAKLPGVGNKSAQRMALYVINMPIEHVERFAQVMVDAKKNIHYCNTCYTLTDQETCPICSNPNRDHKTIMVVENIRDLAAYEKTGKYNGVYQ